MKFDAILNFMSELGREEIFVNNYYFMILEGKMPKEEALEEFNFVDKFGPNLANIHITSQLIALLDIDYEVFEVRLNKVLKTTKSNK